MLIIFCFLLLYIDSEKLVFLETLDMSLEMKQNTIWEVSDINFDYLHSIEPKEFGVWKAFPLKGLFIIFMFKEKTNDQQYFYISRYYVIDRIFEKPKKIINTHKLFGLYNCIEMKSNIILKDTNFILLDTKNDEVIQYNEKEFINI